MDKNTKEFINKNPFTVIFFLLGLIFGLFLANQINLPEKFYRGVSGNLNLFGGNFEDPTGGLIYDMLVKLPITLIVFALVALIGGFLFAIFGYFIDKENKKFKEKEKELLDKSKKENDEKMDKYQIEKSANKSNLNLRRNISKPLYDPYLGRAVYPKY